MKFCVVALAICACAAAAYHSVAACAAASASAWLNSHPNAVVAHRGCWRGTAENSLQALRNCEALGIQAFEGDVRATKDGVLVWIHDPTLDRTTNLSGSIADLTYAQIKEARLKSGPGGSQSSLTDQKLPRLEEILEASRHLIAVLDIKDGSYEATYRLVHAAKAEKRVIIIAYAGPQQIAQFSFYGKIAFIPVVIQCQPAQVAQSCYSEATIRSAAVFRSYAALNPVAYFVGASADTLAALAPVASKSGIRLADAVDDDAVGASQDVRTIWRSELREGVSVFFSSRPLELEHAIGEAR